MLGIRHCDLLGASGLTAHEREREKERETAAAAAVAAGSAAAGEAGAAEKKRIQLTKAEGVALIGKALRRSRCCTGMVQVPHHTFFSSSFSLLFPPLAPPIPAIQCRTRAAGRIPRRRAVG